MNKKVWLSGLLVGAWSFAAQAQNYYYAQPAPASTGRPYYQDNAPQVSTSQPSGAYYNPSSAAQWNAQYTTPRAGYVPPQYSTSNYKYNQPNQTVQKSIFDNRITVGVDYVAGFASYEDTRFSVASPLTGGDDYVAGTRDFDRMTNGLSVNMGWRVFKNFGIEAFYTKSLDQKKVSRTESYSHYPEFARAEYTIYYKGYGLDLLGYYPVNDFIEVLASIGVGKYDAEAKVKVVAYEDSSHNSLRDNSRTFSDSVMAYRVGGGLQMWLSRHIALRLMGRWTSMSGDFMRYITEINAGIRYHF
ncbi:MAG: hypothetical protein IJ184_03020 [Alphaproteobacteria bacterium]|nr:hypothetical protein [Alphaproteobacteria bacterium]